jgi:hypothetical protein
MRREIIMNCPKCGSDNTQKLQVVFEQGTYGDESKGYVGSAPVTLQTTGRSLLAAKYSPPKKAAPVLTILLGLIVAFCLGVVVKIIAGNSAISTGIMVATFILFAWKAFNGFRFNSVQYPILMNAWMKSWVCMNVVRCIKKMHNQSHQADGFAAAVLKRYA